MLSPTTESIGDDPGFGASPAPLPVVGFGVVRRVWAGLIKGAVRVGDAFYSGGGKRLDSRGIGRISGPPLLT